jgi:DNA-directed RNA polymerase sigma subunit (sigma70/sigma32)
MGVCKERIRQIQTRALDKLRGMAAEAKLEQTVDNWL